jgi:ABC-type transport system involved in multi-copper enzyme maturation permease subunit
MTVLTTPVRPGRDAGQEPGPAQWPGMLWVTWRQHRVALISVLTVYVVAAVFMLITGPKIHHDYAALTACHPAASLTCQNLSAFFNSTDWHQGTAAQVALLAIPVLIAMFVGPPVVARELENGTFRYAWTQGIGRVRWTLAKLAILGSVLTLAALAVSQLLTWYFAPFLATQDLTVLSPSVFASHGFVYAAWTLTAVCVGVFLGTLIRRVLPAMAASLGSYAGLAALTWFYLRDHYPVATFWPRQLFEAGWLLVLSAALIAGTIWQVRRRAV